MPPTPAPVHYTPPAMHDTPAPAPAPVHVMPPVPAPTHYMPPAPAPVHYTPPAPAMHDVPVPAPAPAPVHVMPPAPAPVPAPVHYTPSVPASAPAPVQYSSPAMHDAVTTHDVPPTYDHSAVSNYANGADYHAAHSAVGTGDELTGTFSGHETLTFHFDSTQSFDASFGGHDHSAFVVTGHEHLSVDVSVNVDFSGSFHAAHAVVPAVHC
ncbi:hypothetical protein RI367_005194 [Sorochytrium milnesiophthora]